MLRVCGILWAFTAASASFLASGALGDEALKKANACALDNGGWDFSLRSDFNDLGPLTCPISPIAAQGSTLSPADNLLTGQKSTAVDGLAAVDYRYRTGGDFHGFAVGSYLLADDTYQFEPTSSQAHNGSTLTPGGFGEVAFRDPFLNFAEDDIRVRGGEAYASTGAWSDTIVGEFIPRYFLGRLDYHLLNIGYWQPFEPASPYYYNIQPELMVQYDHLNGGPNKALIFSSRDEAMRVGPQFVLLLANDKDKLPDGPFKTLLANSSINVTNHELWDTYTGRFYTWSAISATYTIPNSILGIPENIFGLQTPLVGVTGSVGYGNSELTGNKTAMIKIGLAIKH